MTALRVRLRDGRHLPYAESEPRKKDASYKIVFPHGFSGSRLDTLHTSPVNMCIAILPMFAEFGWNSRTVGLIQSSFFNLVLPPNSDSRRNMGRYSWGELFLASVWSGGL